MLLYSWRNFGLLGFTEIETSSGEYNFTGTVCLKWMQCLLHLVKTVIIQTLSKGMTGIICTADC